MVRTMTIKSRIDGINSLLDMEGFNHKGKQRLSHLSDEEIFALCLYRPEDMCIWPNHVKEVQLLLSKIDWVRKQECIQGRSLVMGRPQITAELACAVCKLSCLRHLSDNGFQLVLARKLRVLLSMGIGPGFFEMFFEIEQDGIVTASRRTISIQSAIQFMELYRDELMKPPRIKAKKTFDEFELHDIESGNFSWLDDDGESYLETIRDMPFETYFDELPKVSPVLDWFIATKPVFDKNQLRRGWLFLEKSSDAWHQRNEAGESYDEIISEYPSWDCIFATQLDRNLSVIPIGNPFTIVPLTTPQQLLEESQIMHHCVVTYIENCIWGGTKIFSVREAGNNQRFATAELSLISGEWKLVQLKGKANLELMHRLHVTGDPLAIALNALVDWYNNNSPEQLGNQGREEAKK